MDDQMALARIDGFLSELEWNHRLMQEFPREYPDARRQSDAGIAESLPLMEQMADQLEPGLSENFARRGSPWSWSSARTAALRMRGLIVNRQQAAAILGPAGPQLAASGLHAWVWDAAAILWDDEFHREAVGAAASHVDQRLQAKLGRHDLSGTKLVTEAFSPKPPTPGNPRLRFIDVEPNSQAWTDRHEGAMNFGRGCMQAIRNSAHHGTEVSDDQLALEQLAALSVLARWIDDAGVEYGE